MPGEEVAVAGAWGGWIEQLRAAGVVELASAGGLLVAGVGILLTLWQVGLFRRQLKLDALIKIMDSNREIVGLGFEHPAIWAALEMGQGALSPEEARVRRRYLQLWMNHIQIVWGAWQLGWVSGREWAAYRLDIVEFLRTPALREYWARVARFYPRGFQRLIAKLAEATDAAPAACPDGVAPPNGA